MTCCMRLLLVVELLECILYTLKICFEFITLNFIEFEYTLIIDRDMYKLEAFGIKAVNVWTFVKY